MSACVRDSAGRLTCWAAMLVVLPLAQRATDAAEAASYRRFRVIEEGGRVAAVEPLPDPSPPVWASRVSQDARDWTAGPPRDRPLFAPPIPFVKPPEQGSGEPFHLHNHQPAITWCPNGDLLAVWYTTEGQQDKGEHDLLLTVLASRLRAGGTGWDPSSEFFKAADRNMHGSAVFHDGAGTRGPAAGAGWPCCSAPAPTMASPGARPGPSPAEPPTRSETR